ncbi:MAG: Pr6Pr family membrane protein [Acidobacteriota bacterium]|nr:Pr6Pr family membrane protein [Acidobacteriota bacterium]
MDRLAVQFFVLYSVKGSVMASLGIMIVYFTITTNVLVAVLFMGFAAGFLPFGRSSAVAGTALSILLVGVVYHLLLRGLLELSGGSAVSNVLLHQVTPVVVPVFWLLFLPKGRLRWIDPVIWAIYPLAYLAYAVVWGCAHGRYPYPFLDVGELGWERVGLNSLVIAAGFLIAAWGLVMADRWLGRHKGALVREAS